MLPRITQKYHKISTKFPNIKMKLLKYFCASTVTLSINIYHLIKNWPFMKRCSGMADKNINVYVKLTYI